MSDETPEDQSKKPDNVLTFVKNDKKDKFVPPEDSFVPSQEVIDHLEYLLEEARDGCITEIMTVCNMFDGIDVEAEWAGTATDPDKMIGSLESMKIRYRIWCDTVDEIPEE